MDADHPSDDEGAATTRTRCRWNAREFADMLKSVVQDQPDAVLCCFGSERSNGARVKSDEDEVAEHSKLIAKLHEAASNLSFKKLWSKAVCVCCMPT